jgi:serine/threonine protein kinase
MEKIGSYLLSGSLTNQNAGYSVWGFGKKDGRDYFIKQFVDQKYPANDTVSSPERLARKIKACERFEERKTALYQKINENSDGNAVRIEEFFRIESKYYISMRKIDALSLGVEDIAKLPVGEIKRLCAIIAHGVASLHKGRVVHADLKPDNILFMKTTAGYTTAKIIDFDSGFLETAAPGPGETIVGDFHYFSPEACRYIWGNEVELTCKMDIFALGVLFHQYFYGNLPGFDTKVSAYSGEAAAKGEVLKVSSTLPDDVRELLTRMLDNDPEKRPTAKEVYSTLRGVKDADEEASEEETPEEEPDEEPEIVEEETTVKETVIEKSTTSENPFFRPGDL